MVKKEKKVEFDLSTLSLKELIEVYKVVEDYLKYIENKKMKLEEELGK